MLTDKGHQNETKWQRNEIESGEVRSPTEKEDTGSWETQQRAEQERQDDNGRARGYTGVRLPRRFAMDLRTVVKLGEDADHGCCNRAPSPRPTGVCFCNRKIMWM